MVGSLDSSSTAHERCGLGLCQAWPHGPVGKVTGGPRARPGFNAQGYHHCKVACPILYPAVHALISGGRTMASGTERGERGQSPLKPYPQDQCQERPQRRDLAVAGSSPHTPMGKLTPGDLPRSQGRARVRSKRSGLSRETHSRPTRTHTASVVITET